MFWVLLFILSGIQSYLPDIDQELRLCGKIRLLELTIEKVHGYYLSGKLTPQKLVECYIKRIDEMNMGLGNIIEVNEDIPELQHNFSMTWIDQPLYGIPIIISGSIATNDSLTTSYLNYTLPSSQRREAKIVTILKKAGAIILGKARGDSAEFANPYNLRRKNQGCSAGVAVTSNLAMLGICSDSERSTLVSASALSLVAIKMVRKDVYMDGVLVAEPFKNTFVLLSRTVIDCFKLFKLLSLSACHEPKDLVSPLGSNHYIEDKLQRYSAKWLGVVDESLFQSTQTLQTPYLREVVKRMKRSDIQVTSELLVASEAIACIQASLKATTSLQQATLGVHAPNIPCKLDRNLKERTLAEITSTLTFYGLEALVLPSPIAEFLSELPLLAIPAGYKTDSTPYGISLVTKQEWTESLFNIAYRIETIDVTLRYRPNFLA